MRWLFRLFLILLLALGLVGFSMVERDPIIAKTEPPSSKDVREARALVQRIRFLSRAPEASEQVLEVSAATLEGALRMGARMVPGFRGQTQLEEGQLRVLAAAPIPKTKGAFWVNLDVSVPSYTGELQLNEVRIGRISLPPALALWIGRVGADLFMGAGSSEAIMTAVEQLDVTPEQITARLDLDVSQRSEIAARVFGTLRGGTLPSAPEIDRYYVAIREALDDGRLPTRGSFIPHLRFALEMAAEDTGADNRANAYTAAIFALAEACGASEFGLISERLVPDWTDAGRDWQRGCSKVTFANRIDSKRHFVTASAIQAASNRGVAVSIGEFKELFDKTRSGGFDFTDITANNSGIRLANRMMGAPADDWPRLLSRIQTESDVLASFEGIPGLMPRKEFDDRFGSVDSPAYRAMLDRIEARIDGLPLHATP